MAVDVHIIKMEEHGVGVAVLQDGLGGIANGGIARDVQGFVDVLAKDVVIDRCPVTNGVGVE